MVIDIIAGFLGFFNVFGKIFQGIYSYFDGSLEAETFLTTLKDRLAVAKRCVEEFEARLTKRGIHTQFMPPALSKFIMLANEINCRL